MPTILLIRHGENDYVKKGRLAGRLAGVHLNDHGRKQADKLAEVLKAAPIKAVYSSPLERAQETAEPLARALNLPVITRPGLIETDFGEWQDQSLKGLRRLKLWKTVQQAPSLMRFPGGESFAETQLRVTQELQQLAAQHDARDLFACVCHADPIKLAVAYFTGIPLDGFQRIHVAPASITTLALGEQGAMLVNLNVDVAFSFDPPATPAKKPRSGTIPASGGAPKSNG